MKNLLGAAVVLSVVVVPAVAAAQDASALKTDREKQSYAVGVQMANNMKQNGVDLDAALMAQGLKDAFSGKTLLTESEVKDAVMAFQKGLIEKQQAAHKAAGDKAKTEGDAFLAANAKKDGVVVLPSGLQYKVITAGTGPMPKATDTVTVNYAGHFLDGTEFDSSYKRNEPATFPLNQVIKGWTEALQLMKVGSKWEIFVPGDLAYGEQGRPGIPPNSTLVFEVELLGIK
jgi:FKBP-type peptidyl-prolyl cis-trans isomerase FklB